MPLPICGEGIAAAIEVMIKTVDFRLSQAEEPIKTLSPKSRFKEFCTLRIQAPRGAGHSFAIARVLDHWQEQRRLPFLVATLSPKQMERIPCAFGYHHQLIMSHLASPELRRYGFPALDTISFKPYAGIIVDIASTWNPTMIDSLYEAAVKSVPDRLNFYFIFVG